MRALLQRTSAETLPLLGALALVVASSIRFLDYAYDDAYITYRYARNVLLGQGFVYNPGDSFLGTTTPLYTLVLAGLGSVMEIPLASGLLSVLSVVVGVIAIDALGRDAGIRHAGVLFSVFVAFNRQLFAIFGGETLFVYFGLIPLAHLLGRRGRPLLAAPLFAAAILGRMDAVLFVGLHYGALAFETWRRERRIPWKPALVVALGVMPWFVYSLVVFGVVFPSTLGAKIAQGESGGWLLYFAGAARYLPRLIEYAGPLRFVFLPLLGLGIFRVLTRERVWLIFLVNSVSFALVYQFALGASFSHWYLANVYLTNALLLAAGLRQLTALGDRLGRTRWLARAAVASLVIAHLATAFADTRMIEVHPGRRVLYTNTGEWLKANTPESASVAFFEIGYLGWFSDRTIIDPVGLVTPGGAEGLLAGNRYWFFEARRPDYYLHATKTAGQEILRNPWFNRNYERIAAFEEKGHPNQLILFRRRTGPIGSS